MTTSAIGQRGEQIAAILLERLGYSIIDRHVVDRWGEIDIVAQRDSITYFIEVKWRRTQTYGAALESITPQKLKRLKTSILRYVQKHSNIGQFYLLFVFLQGAPGSIHCTILPMEV